MSSSSITNTTTTTTIITTAITIKQHKIVRMESSLA